MVKYIVFILILVIIYQVSNLTKKLGLVNLNVKRIVTRNEAYQGEKNKTDYYNRE